MDCKKELRTIEKGRFLGNCYREREYNLEAV